MSQSIIIQSVNYDGEIANILFNPYGEEIVFNLGDHELPFEFTPSLLEPPKEVYGTYTILVLNSDFTPINVTTVYRGFNLVSKGNTEILKSSVELIWEDFQKTFQ